MKEEIRPLEGTLPFEEMSYEQLSIELSVIQSAVSDASSLALTTKSLEETVPLAILFAFVGIVFGVYSAGASLWQVIAIFGLGFLVTKLASNKFVTNRLEQTERLTEGHAIQKRILAEIRKKAPKMKKRSGKRHRKIKNKARVNPDA